MLGRPCVLLAVVLGAGAAYAMDRTGGAKAAASPPEAMGDTSDDDGESQADGSDDGMEDFAEVGLREWSGEFTYLNTHKEDLWLTLVPCEENQAGAVCARFTDRLVLLSLERNPSCFLRPGEAVALAAEIAPGRTPACRFLHAELGKVQWTLMLNSRDGKGDLSLLLSPSPSRTKTGKVPFLKLQSGPNPPMDAKAAAAAGGAGPQQPPAATPALGAAAATAAPPPQDGKSLT